MPVAPRIFASVGLFGVIAACGPTSSSPTGSCDEVEVIVATSNHEVTGVADLCGVPGSCVNGAELGNEPVLADSNDRVFFVAREKDLLIEVDPKCGRLKTPATTFSLNRYAPRESATSFANPHDVAAAPDGTLVVPLYNVPKLVFVKDGQYIDLDLSSYDPDGNPEAESVSVVNVGGVPKAFVTLERLTVVKERGSVSLRSLLPSQMLRIDVGTRTVEARIDLAGHNPFNPMAVLDGALFLSEPGNYDSVTEPTAGIERFDTATSTTRLLIGEEKIGASVVQVAVSKGCGAAIVAATGLTNPTSVVTFDPDSGELLSTVAAPILGPTPGYELYGMTWRGDRLYVGDRRRAENGFPVHVFQRSGACTLTEIPSAIALPQEPVAIRPARETVSNP